MTCCRPPPPKKKVVVTPAVVAMPKCRARRAQRALARLLVANPPWDSQPWGRTGGLTDDEFPFGKDEWVWTSDDDDDDSSSGPEDLIYENESEMRFWEDLPPLKGRADRLGEDDEQTESEDGAEELLDQTVLGGCRRVCVCVCVCWCVGVVCVCGNMSVRCRTPLTTSRRR